MSDLSLIGSDGEEIRKPGLSGITDGQTYVRLDSILAASVEQFRAEGEQKTQLIVVTAGGSFRLDMSAANQGLEVALSVAHKLMLGSVVDLRQVEKQEDTP